MDTAQWLKTIEVHEAMSDDPFDMDERARSNVWRACDPEDIIKQPNHYTHYAIEPKNFIIRNNMEFWRGNIVKYAARAGYKEYEGMDEFESAIADLKKVIRYAEMRINQINGEYDI